MTIPMAKDVAEIYPDSIAPDPFNVLYGNLDIYVAVGIAVIVSQSDGERLVYVDG